MVQHPDGATRELLSFRVERQEFCLDIGLVREIRGWTPATRLPHAPPYMRGVVNLRGAILPIVDLAARTGLPATEPTKLHVVIVVEEHDPAPGRSKPRTVGLLVSAVCDILTVPSSSIQDTHDVVTPLTRAFVQGLLTVDDRMLAVLRLGAVLPELADAA